jgi:nitroreductase
VTISAATTRKPDHAIDPLFFRRWSPRAAPSAMNVQPWRFVYARRGAPAFDRFLAVLAQSNQLSGLGGLRLSSPWSRAS